MLRLLPAILCVIYLLPACHRTPEEDTLSIVFTGDVLLDRGVRPWIERHDAAYVFKDVSPVFRQADAVVINLECPLTDTATPLNKQFIFRGDTRWADGLRQSGITHATMANNHTNDQGRRGIADTYHALQAADITPLGYGHTREEQLNPTVIAKGNIRVALFNAVLFPLENWQYIEGQPDICQPSVKRLSDHIRQYKTRHPDTYIVTVVHWGTEFQPHPNLQQRYDARRLAEAGTDVLIGHHPHVLQDEERLGNSTIFYSLGNFVFDQSHPDTRRSMMVVADFSGTGVQTRTIPVKIRQCKPRISRKTSPNRHTR